jgi:hypothetical protein
MIKTKIISVMAMRWLFFLLLTGMIFFPSCGRKDLSSEDELNLAGQPDYYKENDTLGISPVPENLSLWINYYQQTDTSFRLKNFLASGVKIHMNELEDATTGDLSLMENFFPLFSFSPDSSQLIDFWSYNQLIETNQSGERLVIGGDPDQEVVWINKITGTKKQIMYNGPQQIVETADWVNNEAFLLGMMNVDEGNKNWSPEILLFNLKDSTFTNFRLNKTMPADKMAMEGVDFTAFWLKRKNYKRG